MMNVRNVIKLAVGLLFLTLVSWIVIKVMRKEDKSQIEYISAIPSVDLMDTHYNTVSLDSLISDAKHYILVFYSPGCLFCEHEAADLSRNKNEFKDRKVVFITQESIDSAIAYSIRHNLMAVDNFHVLVDTSYSILPQFGIKMIPTTLIYDEKKEFVTSFEGEVNAKRILKILVREQEEQF